MTFLTADTTPVSLGELHDLNPDEFTKLIIEVRRRIEPGAGQFGGIQFLSNSEPVAQFDTVANALQFIDDLHDGGIPQAIRGQLGDDISDAAVVAELQFANDNMAPGEYLNRAGLTDPFNLQVIPKKETTRPVDIEEHPSTDAPTDADIEV